MSALLLGVLAVLGLVVGGVANTVIVRLPDDRPLRRPGPECPECTTRLGWGDVVPVVSWVRLRGRCRACASPIPLAYPLVELGMAGLWVVAGIRFGPSLELIPYLVLFTVLLTQSVIDLELYLLLDRITFPALAVEVVVLGGIAVARGDLGPARSALIGALVYFLLLFVPALIYPRGMGFGDVKLAALMGLLLGWINPLLTLYALVTASLLGIVAGTALWLVRGREGSHFPFGPWLAAGCVLAIVFSASLLR
ncbi:MAG: prepilin peptidase [Actinobacteria bacterium]|nr:prepilin peptidase [Actinomycetota bacterium]